MSLPNINKRPFPVNQAFADYPVKKTKFNSVGTNLPVDWSKELRTEIHYRHHGTKLSERAITKRKITIHASESFREELRKIREFLSSNLVCAQKVLVKIKNHRTSSLLCMSSRIMELSFASTF